MGIKLVMVDDAPFIREAVRGLVRGTEIEFAAEATNGEEAVKIVRKIKPDVVLMDLVLPLKNGIDAAKEILAENKSVKIIACSTEGQEGLMIRALDAGCSNFLQKPFKGEDLMRVIRAAVGSVPTKQKSVR